MSTTAELIQAYNVLAAAAGEDEPAEPLKAEPTPKNKVHEKKLTDGRADFAEYLAKHKLNPKVARMKLRKAGLKGPYVLDKKVIEVLK